MVPYTSANGLRNQSSSANLASAHQREQKHGSQQPAATTPYLSHDQQDLLLAALNAQAKDRQNTSQSTSASGFTTEPATSAPALQQANMSNTSLFMSPQDAELDNYNGDYTPDLDYLDGDNSFDFDNADLGGEMIGALPRSNSELADDEVDGGHEKRKNPDDQDDDDEADPKRQEGEKGAKKPGRKPLTSEPTTKRKAQNRAAQRAFRERKEKHLKDLETKVTEMNKAHEADRHENGMLKAQVDRLQVELREYRKRLSLNGGSGNAKGSPPLSAYTGTSRSNSGPTAAKNGNFQFDFPKFGALPGSQIFSNQQQNSSNGVLQRGSVTPPVNLANQVHGPTAGIIGALPGAGVQLPAQVSRTNSQSSQHGMRTLSPKTTTPVGSSVPTPSQMSNTFPSVGYSSANNMHGFASTLPQMGDDNLFGGLFSPSLLKNANFDTETSYFNPAPQQQPSAPASAKHSIDASTGGESTAGLNRVFQFNGSSSGASDSASPSNSSTSQWNAHGANSSCGTSPEPSHGSPADKLHHGGSADSYANEKPSLLSQYSDPAPYTGIQQQQPFGGWGNSGLGATNVDFSVQSAGTFDPVLFGDYRDTGDAAFGTTNDFGAGNGFFDDALNTAPFDYGSPSNLFGILQQSPQQTHTQTPLSLGGIGSIGNAAPASTGSSAVAPSKNLMAQIEKARDGGDDDYGLPSGSGSGSVANAKPAVDAKQMNGKLISCNNIWNQLQSNPDFQAGTFDLDSLCSELRAKARCSESGVMVSQDHVDAALKKLAAPGLGAEEMPPLLFEEESWNQVLRRLGEKQGGR
ncbi:DNA-binding transcription factor yap1 [Teratosphaeriaceae sp. CCFEE 6253]|nr:DNA-binding transcription factor yap1 [Teratosphaeriaceae sp. CCFEE 6253]